MILIPLRTNSPIRRTPTANYALIAANVLAFLLTYDFAPAPPAGFPGAVGAPSGPLRASLGESQLMLDGADPRVHQLFTYQFLHDGWQHLLGNMLFLWVFGNSVNAKMGQVAYVLFYLSCGVLAGTAYLVVSDSPMLGASGAIAGVTTGFLVLFPRSKTSFFYWFFVIGYFELPSMILIVAKVIVYDNVIAPALSGATGVAYSAHIAGYVGGLAIAALLLLIRAVPRDQFDLIALWKRAYQRRAFAQTMAGDPVAQARAQFGQMARTDSPSASGQETTPTVEQIDQGVEIRREVSAAFSAGDLDAVLLGYRKLTDLNADLVLSRQQQFDVANCLASRRQYDPAAEAYEKYLTHYPTAPQHEQVRLMLGIIYAKHLSRNEKAETHLLACREYLSDPGQIEQCGTWLGTVAEALGRSRPEPE